MSCYGQSPMYYEQTLVGRYCQYYTDSKTTYMLHLRKEMKEKHSPLHPL